MCTCSCDFLGKWNVRRYKVSQGGTGYIYNSTHPDVKCVQASTSAYACGLVRLQVYFGAILPLPDVDSVHLSYNLMRCRLSLVASAMIGLQNDACGVQVHPTCIPCTPYDLKCELASSHFKSTAGLGQTAWEDSLAAVRAALSGNAAVRLCWR